MISWIFLFYYFHFISLICFSFRLNADRRAKSADIVSNSVAMLRHLITTGVS